MHIELKGIEETNLARLDGNIGTISVVFMQDQISMVQESIKERKEEFKDYINQVRFYLLLLSLHLEILKQIIGPRCPGKKSASENFLWKLVRHRNMILKPAFS